MHLHGNLSQVNTAVVVQLVTSAPHHTPATALPQVAGMLNKATCHSLIICDEFGKGTLTYDGVGLLAASLQQFCSMAQPPRALACTHFHELFSPDIMRRWGDAYH